MKYLSQYMCLHCLSSPSGLWSWLVYLINCAFLTGLLAQFCIHFSSFTVKTYQSVNTLLLWNFIQDPMCPVLHHLGTSGHVLPRSGEYRGSWGDALPFVDSFHVLPLRTPSSWPHRFYIFIFFLLRFNCIMDKIAKIKIRFQKNC